MIQRVSLHNRVFTKRWLLAHSLCKPRLCVWPCLSEFYLFIFGWDGSKEKYATWSFFCTRSSVVGQHQRWFILPSINQALPWTRQPPPGESLLHNEHTVSHSLSLSYTYTHSYTHTHTHTRVGRSALRCSLLCFIWNCSSGTLRLHSLTLLAVVHTSLVCV